MKIYILQFTTGKKSYHQKKILNGVLSLAAVFFLNACGKTEDSKASTQIVDSVLDKTKEIAAKAKLEAVHSSTALKDKTEETFSNAGKALKNATANVGSSAQTATDKAIVKIDDLAITTAISAELIKDPEIRVFMIKVNTKDGAVTLTGSVSTPAARDRAVAISRTFNGVESVDNKLSIKTN